MIFYLSAFAVTLKNCFEIAFEWYIFVGIFFIYYSSRFYAYYIYSEFIRLALQFVNLDIENEWGMYLEWVYSSRIENYFVLKYFKIFLLIFPNYLVFDLICLWEFIYYYLIVFLAIVIILFTLKSFLCIFII